MIRDLDYLRRRPGVKQLSSGMALICLLLFKPAFAQGDKLVEEVEQDMLRATRFMVEEVSYMGGYVWNYLPDFSRQWGEMEAYPTMIWTQPPGTPSMGQLFLDAYRATGDDYYYQAAEKVARALIWGQHSSGGWNYIIDFAGDQSLQNWYATIGKNGWRLEEFNYYEGNATFDDDATYAPAMFLLRLYMEKNDPVYLASLKRAIAFVLESQYPTGGWPQRYPPSLVHTDRVRPGYTSYITLNDGVHRDNVRFLIACYRALGDQHLLEPIRRALNCILLLQQGAPQPGWSWQFTPDLKPAGARSYEPDGIYTGATYHSISLLMDYYELTGDSRFLARVPEAIDYLESLALPAEVAAFYPREIKPGQRVFPSCVEIGSNQPVYVHRKGSDATNGTYYSDHDPVNQWMPTFSMRALDPGQLTERYQRLTSTPSGEVTKDSPLKVATPDPLPRYFYQAGRGVKEEDVKDILDRLGEKSYWEGIFAGSNPYIGEGPPEAAPGDFSATQVGDRYDTSPYRFGEDLRGISTREYITQMTALISFLDSVRDSQEAP